MTRLRRVFAGRLAALLGVLAIMANVLAPAALAGVGARAKAAMFAGPFNAPICHGGSLLGDDGKLDSGAKPGMHCPLCQTPAATALAASAAGPVAVSFRWLANPVEPRVSHAASFALPSEHRPRAPPACS